MIRPRWSPEINFGHVLQAVVIFFTVGGGAVTSYISLRMDAAEQRRSFEMAQAMTNARVLVLENLRPYDEDFRRETRTKLDKLLESVAELRPSKRAENGGLR